MMIRVLVVADSAVVRAGLSAMLKANPEFMVVGSISDADVLAEIEQLQPDVVLLDGDSEPDLTEYGPGIIILTDEDLDVEATLRSGVRGILPQVSAESEILAAVEAVASGLVALHPDIVETLLPRRSLWSDRVNPVQALTPREIEVLQMLSSGLGNKAIAQHLHISEHTVKFHVSSILQKFAVSTRTEAVAMGIRLGLIML